MAKGDPVPLKPVELEEVHRIFPMVRQSDLSAFDDCALGALFRLRYARGWSTHPQARGQIFHRFAAHALREMREHDSETIPVGVALELLEHALAQEDVPPEDIVRVPLRELPALEMSVRKFAKDNAFSVRNIIDIERRLEAPLSYITADGEKVERVLTGQIDALIAEPPDEAVVIDWKDTWMLPPERHEDAEDPGVSYHGYFQQRFYGWLVMMNYPAVQAVILREFYVRRTKARPARLTRDQLPKVEEQLGRLVKAFDAAVAAGEPPRLDMDTVEAHGHWKPSPGKHCDWCVASSRCPIEDDAKMEGGVRNLEQAKQAVAEMQVGRAIAKSRAKAVAPFVDLHGPVEARWAKGRLVYGYRQLANGQTRLDLYAPEKGDRPPTRMARNPNLEEAMKASTERARAARDG